MGSARLFVCVWPDEAAVETLRVLHRKDQPGVRFVPEENWHVTLRFLGQAEPGAVAEALADVRVAPTEAVLGPVVDLLSDHSMVVPVGGLAEWAEAVNRATRGLGDSPIRRRFVGHVTLARLGASVRRGRGRAPQLLGTPVAARFPVRGFDLVVSHLGPAGPRYEPIASFTATG